MAAGIEHKPVQTIAISGGKSGVGKSTIAINLAMALSEMGREVLLLDANLGLGNIDVLLGIGGDHDLSDVLNGDCELSQILLEGPGGIKIVPGARGNEEMARLSQIQHIGIVNLFSDSALDADTLVVDTEAGLSDSGLSFSQASREVVVVVTDEPSSLQDAFATIEALSTDIPQCDRFRIIANKVDSSKHGLELYQRLCTLTYETLDVVLDFCGSIPLDSQLNNAVCEKRAVLEAYPAARSARSIRELATRVEHWPRPLEPKGHLEFFVERQVCPGLDAR